MKKSKILTPDEIEFAHEDHSQHDDLHSFNLMNEGQLESIRTFCNKRPWIRILALLLLGLSALLGVVLLFFSLASFALAAVGLFKNETWNSWQATVWRVFCFMMAVLVAFFVGIFSPLFGVGVLIMYITCIRPLPILNTWMHQYEKDLH